MGMVLRASTGGVALHTIRVRGYHPWKIWKFYVQNGALWGKIALCFDYKKTKILTQTFGHKWFSEVA